ncbi:hypothetical protein BZL30_5086 [Mycobacterium kansasii]|uniref:Uncharacterized protein n=1 Tax=Mycobacterium kansasii TaxID=1768 RepID=A0A1V3X466_MYCKA|nr:hypothetical protein BZL30_5086 [Mycobacterium kansasii]
MDRSGHPACLGGGFEQHGLRAMRPRHYHRISIGGQQLARQLVLSVGLIPVDVQKKHQSERRSGCLALSPAQPEGVDLTGLGVGLRCVRQ